MRKASDFSAELDVPCRPCYNRGQGMLNTSQATMAEFIDISLPESIAERLNSVGWTRLTDAQREVVCVYRLHWQLFHGGLSAVVANLSRAELDTAVAGLTRIGAPRAASLISRAINNANVEVLDSIETDLGGSEIAAIRLQVPEQYAAN